MGDRVDLGPLDRQVRFERKAASTDFMSAGQNAWAPVMTIAATFKPIQPSRANRQDDDLNITKAPAYVRAYWRAGVTSDMRMVLLGRGGGEADRTLKIVAGPAELGSKRGMELMVEDYSTQGQPA